MTGRTRRFADKRDAILDGAARLFNERGVRGALLSDVAQQVGLATNSLTYYYRKKEDLAAACLLRSMDALGAAADAAARAPTLQARVQGFLDSYLGLLARIDDGLHPELIVFSDVLTLGPPQHEMVAAAYTQMFRRVRALLDAPDAPALGAAARNARAHLLLSTTTWARAWVRRYESTDYPRVAGRIGTLLLAGVPSAPGQGLAPATSPLALAAALGDGDTRNAYLRAATRLVNEHGYHGASVDRIAAELQLTKGSFYHHHETKEELIAACFERTFAVVRAAQSAALDAPGPGGDRLALACRALLDFQLSAFGPAAAHHRLDRPARGPAQRHAAHHVAPGRTLCHAGHRRHGRRVAAHRRPVGRGAGHQRHDQRRGRDRTLGARHRQAANAFELYARPLFTGLLPAGDARAVPAPFSTRSRRSKALP
jgi:AcrR family transcriptional regulator